MKKFILSVLAVCGVVMSANAVSAKTVEPVVPTKERPQMSPEKKEEMKAKHEDRANKRFDKLDTNKDGKISKEEFDAGNKEKSDKRFDKLDTDKDGLVSKEEMAAGKGKMKKEHMKKGMGMGHGPAKMPEPEKKN